MEATELEIPVLPGHSACPGCGGAVAERLVLKVLGRRTIWFGEGVCAGACSRFNLLPTLDLHFSGCSGAGASGIVSALEVKGVKDITVVSSGGDGALSDIGLSQASGCAQRNDNFIQLCLDNEGYMNTGIQASSQTPFGAWTTTTVRGNPRPKKNLPLIIAHHHVPYVATASISHPADLMRKVEKAKGIEGYRYLHILCPCPTGWRFPFERTIEVGRLAVQTRVWPLYEIEEGKLRISLKPGGKPVRDYLAVQGRFRSLKESDIQEVQARVDKYWENLEKFEAHGLF